MYMGYEVESPYLQDVRTLVRTFDCRQEYLEQDTVNKNVEACSRMRSVDVKKQICLSEGEMLFHR